MAGIGFELKKLFNKKGFVNYVRAYMYSSIVSIGPAVLCLLMISAVQIIMLNLDVADFHKELFFAAVVYSFIFSQIITSGFSMIITRFISDKLYRKEYKEIIPSLYGTIGLCLLIGAVPAGVFFYKSTLNWQFKLVNYLLYMELIVMWIETNYLSALKDYIKIVRAFLFGIMVVIALSYINLKFTNIEESLGLIFSMLIGIYFIVVRLMIQIKSFFKSSSKQYFLFLRYLDKYSELFFINLFYSSALYIHNFIFWRSELGIKIVDTYVYSPLYDVPTFYAFLSILPSMVVFVVFIETNFYEKYRTYYSYITQKGNYKEIQSAKKDMINTLKQEIINTMELQLVFSLASFVLGNIFLPKIGLDGFPLDIFNILLLGAYANVIMLIVILMLLYFDDRKGALMISALFISSNILFTIITINLNENYYGLGFFTAAFISSVLSIVRLSYFLKDIDYYTFCSQPIIYKDKEGIFTNITKKLYK